MNCCWVSSLISAYMDGELTGIEMLQVRRHLDECRACTLQYESLRHVKQTLSSLACAPPRVGLAERISARLDSARIPRYQKVFGPILVFGRERLTPVAAGCAALGGVLMILVAGAMSKPDVVALERPPMYAGMISPAPAEASPAPAFPVAYELPRPVVFEPPHEESSRPGAFSFASVEAH